VRGFYWRLADKTHQSEIKRTFIVALGLSAPFEWPIGSGRFRGRAFNLWINIPWACVSVEWNTEEQKHDYLRDGITFSWGRNKGWSVRHDNYYKHRCTFFSRLKLNPIYDYADGEGLKLRKFNREMAH
jgi:hypothetical protein